jgi:5-methylcytosine-specific restriction endonuclease McrA
MDKAAQQEYNRRYRAANRARLIAYDSARAKTPKRKKAAADYRAAHRSQAVGRAQRWYAENRERRRGYIEAHYRENKAYYVEKAVRWNSAHPAIAKSRQRAWKRENQATVREQTLRRYAIKRGATIGDTAVIAEWVKSWRDQPSVTCYWCNEKFPGDRCHQDHIVPLSAGGPHDLSNLCVACPDCNQRKHAKLPEVWNLTLRQPRLFL